VVAREVKQDGENFFQVAVTIQDRRDLAAPGFLLFEVRNRVSISGQFEAFSNTRAPGGRVP
jgi:hypothetical protein